MLSSQPAPYTAFTTPNLQELQDSILHAVPALSTGSCTPENLPSSHSADNHEHFGYLFETTEEILFWPPGPGEDDLWSSEVATFVGFRGHYSGIYSSW